MRSVRFLLSCDLSRALRPTAGHTFHGFLAWRVSGYIGKCNIKILVYSLRCFTLPLKEVPGLYCYHDASLGVGGMMQ